MPAIPLSELKNSVNFNTSREDTFFEDVLEFFLDINITHNTLIDVVNDYPWTITPSSYRWNIPYITMIEYEQTQATILANAKFWAGNIFDTIKGDTSNPYKGLYVAKKTGIIYKLPYYNSYNTDIKQNRETNKGILEFNIAEKLLTAYSNIKGILGQTVGVSVTQPKLWSGASPASYPIEFVLFNTINPDDISKNVKFINRLKMSVLHDQITMTDISPPAIFEIRIPGIRRSPAATIANLRVENIGQMNLIKVNGFSQNIPDAYKISITIQEMITESRQIFKDAANNESIIKAITETPPPEPTPPSEPSQSSNQP